MKEKGKGLILAAKSGDIKKVKELIKEKVSLDVADGGGRTALMWASNQGHLEIVKVLAQAGADLDAVNDYGWTALMLASGGGHLEVVKVLIEAGADLDAVDDHGQTALNWASAYGYLEIVKVLAQAGADLDAVDDYGRTALMLALNHGHHEVVEYLKNITISEQNIFEVKIEQVFRPWGNFKQFVKNEQCTVKILKVKKNETLSLQKHKQRVELWYFLTDGYVQIGSETKKIKKDEYVKIPKEEIHRLFAKEEDIEVIEISFGNFDENDEIRLSDKYGRK